MSLGKNMLQIGFPEFSNGYFINNQVSAEKPITLDTYEIKKSEMSISELHARGLLKRGEFGWEII